MNNENLIAKRKDFLFELVGYTKNKFMKGVVGWYTENKKNNIHHKYILKEFQLCLKKVPRWNDVRLQEEMHIFKDDRFMYVVNTYHSLCAVSAKLYERYEDLLLLNRYDTHRRITNFTKFVHDTYIIIARELWRNPQLLYDKIIKSEYMKNLLVVEDIISQSIKTSCRQFSITPKVIEAEAPLPVQTLPIPHQNIIQESDIKQSSQLHKVKSMPALDALVNTEIQDHEYGDNADNKLSNNNDNSNSDNNSCVAEEQEEEDMQGSIVFNDFDSMLMNQRKLLNVSRSPSLSGEAMAPKPSLVTSRVNTPTHSRTSSPPLSRQSSVLSDYDLNDHDAAPVQIPVVIVEKKPTFESDKDEIVKNVVLKKKHKLVNPLNNEQKWYQMYSKLQGKK